MATTSFSSASCSSPTGSAYDHEKLDLKSMWLLVGLINQNIEELLADANAWKSLKLKCFLKLKVQKQEFFEFSEHSTLSNLYWGMDGIEAAIEAKCPEEKASMLKNSEKMLQVPALLDDQGVTTGIPNHYLVCCSYFYLSIVRKLQKDEWQSAIHLLQALIVSPRFVYNEFAPELYRSLFQLCSCQKHNVGNRTFPSNIDDDEVGEAMKLMAKRYKACLTYYQVVSLGETAQWQSECRNIAFHAEGSEYTLNRKARAKFSNSLEGGERLLTQHNSGKVYPFDPSENMPERMANESRTNNVIPGLQNHMKFLPKMEPHIDNNIKIGSGVKRLKDILKDCQSDTPITSDSCSSSTVEDNFSEEDAEVSSSCRIAKVNIKDEQQAMCNHNMLKKHQAPCSTLNPETIKFQAPGQSITQDGNETGITSLSSRMFSQSGNDFGIVLSNIKDPRTLNNCQREKESKHGRIWQQGLQQSSCVGYTARYQSSQLDHQGSLARQNNDSSVSKRYTDVCLLPEENSCLDQIRILEDIVSELCQPQGFGKGEEEYTVGITRINDILNNKTGVRYSLFKDLVLEQLLMSIATSKEEEVIKASVFVLLTMASVNKSVVEDIRKGLPLCDLARALKRNVHEAVILLYLMDPSPAEIQNLELLPALVEVICTSRSYKWRMTSLLLTPPMASMKIIEILLTAFDYTSNNTQLAAIISPNVLPRFLDVPRNNHPEDFVALASILVSCMRFDGECRKYISKYTPLAPFISILRSDQKQATSAVMEFFNEILRIPRVSAISVLQKMQKEERKENVCAMLLQIQKSQAQCKLLAANLLLQLEMLQDLSENSTYQEEALGALLSSMTNEEDSAAQQLSAFILSNLGGTYSWAGEPYTIAWLVKKAGLTSPHHKNTIGNFDWSDYSLQDVSIDQWSSKIAKQLIKSGDHVFYTLETGLKSKTKSVAQYCLTTIAWLGCEIMKSPNDLRYSACEILLSTIATFLHPGLELEDRVLACLSIYNYASGKGKQKLIHFSEGVRESLRRLSSITWMAEELLKVAAYFQPDKWRISCVHTQILEAGSNFSGAVSALTYYKGQLYSGHMDGSIKAWSINGHAATLTMERKEHEKAVTCFSLSEPGNSLLSGSADRTIRIWQVVKSNLECVEVITTKEPLQSMTTCGELIFTITQSHKLKMFDSSRKAKGLFKNKRMKSLTTTQGKIYVGCRDSSIQELCISNNRQREIKASAGGWIMQNKPINSIAVYKDWLYSASSVVKGASIKDWKRCGNPYMSIVPQKGTKVLAMEVVEDFIYLNCNSSTSIIQIWLRGTGQRVGRLSAGSRITSLLTTNDMILCGTETGLIKGWIPL